MHEKREKSFNRSDGNINKNTIPLCVKHGANVLVGGTTSIFRGEDADYISLVREMLES